MARKTLRQRLQEAESLNYKLRVEKKALEDEMDRFRLSISQMLLVMGEKFGNAVILKELVGGGDTNDEPTP